MRAIGELPPIPYDLDDPYEAAMLIGDYPTLDPRLQGIILRHLWLRYRGELRYLDDQIGALLDDMEATGWLDDTLIVLWTDHGEQIYDHGALTHNIDLLREENAAAAIFSGGGVSPGVWEGPTTHVDIWPTTFRALGLAVPPSFLGVPAGQRPPDDHRFALRWQYPPAIQSIEREGLKLLYTWSGEKRLFDTRADPGEAQDLYDPEDPRVRELWELLLPEVEAIYALDDGYAPIDPGP